uniref:Uncharacterized protein n=1 Tax=Esox lucius TaxID=8010 RepID=A0A3P9AGS6_ESOLU
MEYRVQHVPFLQSSNLSFDKLRGNDENIGFEDILNDTYLTIVIGEMHVMME